MYSNYRALLISAGQVMDVLYWIISVLISLVRLPSQINDKTIQMKTKKVKLFRPLFKLNFFPRKEKNRVYSRREINFEVNF